MLIIGSHVSYTKDKGLLGSLEEALAYKANTFMFYTGAPQNTKRYKIDKELTKMAILKMQEVGINLDNIIVHAPYIINLANGDESKYDFSIRFLIEEVKRCEEMGIKYMVLHPGSHVGLGVDVGIKNIIYALNIVLKSSKNVTILLETMAGKGTEIGRSFEEIKQIIDGVERKDLIGVCIDTCHLNDSGYDISNFDAVLEEFAKTIGLNYLKCVHVNDSKNPLGSKKDRHENIGYGTIGFDNLLKVLYNKKLENIPKILETPYISDKAPYKEEIEMIRNRKFNEKLKEIVD